MLSGVWLIPVLPLLSFLVLTLGGSRLTRQLVTWIGVGSVGASAAIAVGLALSFLQTPPVGHAYTQVLWRWMAVADFAPRIALYLDAVSLVMVLVVTFVGFCIHLYSSAFMAEEEGYCRFFACLNLFVAAMLILVLADNLLLLYLGWEGVGLCSYLLIGFWYHDPVNGRAAQKAFILTRIGDAALAVGLFVLWSQLGTLQIQELLQRAVQEWLVGSGLAVTAAALLLAGALGKSAQLPLHTWLPDAMAGPTPVSALIHAATMVTAGVYLIVRLHPLFTLAPLVQSTIGLIGTLTLLMAGCSALTQRDIKRVLAYSTMSQIGYMFLALGVGAWAAALFHLFTHACFKALLFLAAGVVIQGLHHEHDIFRMGGLARQLPIAFGAFLIGGAALAGLPLVTAGFYSKDWILGAVWSADQGSGWLWAAAVTGTVLTSLYIFRVIFLVFFGESKTRVATSPRPPHLAIRLPLGVLAVLSLIGGWLEVPRTLGHLPLFSEFVQTAVPVATAAPAAVGTELGLQLVASLGSVLGIIAAYLFFWRRTGQEWLHAPVSRVLHRVWQVWFDGWGWDRLYEWLFVRPFLWSAAVNRADYIDTVYTGVAQLSQAAHRVLRQTQTGHLRWYATGIAAGALLLVFLVVLT